MIKRHEILVLNQNIETFPRKNLLKKELSPIPQRRKFNKLKQESHPVKMNTDMLKNLFLLLPSQGISILHQNHYL